MDVIPRCLLALAVGLTGLAAWAVATWFLGDAELSHPEQRSRRQ